MKIGEVTDPNFDVMRRSLELQRGVDPNRHEAHLAAYMKELKDEKESCSGMTDMLAGASEEPKDPYVTGGIEYWVSTNCEGPAELQSFMEGLRKLFAKPNLPSIPTPLQDLIEANKRNQSLCTPEYFHVE